MSFFEYPYPPFPIDPDRPLLWEPRAGAQRRRRANGAAIGFTLLSGLFALRVLGQLAVASTSIDFLPPMEYWYSGLVPYSILLPAQLAILALEVMIMRDLWRGSGFFDRAHTRAGARLRVAGSIYLAAMVLRVPITLAVASAAALQAALIPIGFHWILAATVLVYASHLSREPRA